MARDLDLSSRRQRPRRPAINWHSKIESMIRNLGLEVDGAVKSVLIQRHLGLQRAIVERPMFSRPAKHPKHCWISRGSRPKIAGRFGSISQQSSLEIDL
jgi:hypothetical protein